jgi:hypothetical protein
VASRPHDLRVRLERVGVMSGGREVEASKAQMSAQLAALKQST